MKAGFEMIKIFSKRFLLVFILISNLNVVSNSSIASTVEVIQIEELVQNPNDIAISFHQDIESYMSSNTFVYIILLLNQSSNTNGLYIVGFNQSDSPVIQIRLGDQLDNSNNWFNSSSGLIIDYGSIIYIEILDYLTNFGSPDNIGAIVFLTPLTIVQIATNINDFLIEFQNDIVPSTTTELSSTSNEFQINGFELYLFLFSIGIIIIKRKKLA